MIRFCQVLLNNRLRALYITQALPVPMKNDQISMTGGMRPESSGTKLYNLYATKGTLSVRDIRHGRISGRIQTGHFLCVNLLDNS